jgi:hypothetical protein
MGICRGISIEQDNHREAENIEKEVDENKRFNPMKIKQNRHKHEKSL